MLDLEMYLNFNITGTLGYRHYYLQFMDDEIEVSSHDFQIILHETVL